MNRGGPWSIGAVALAVALGLSGLPRAAAQNEDPFAPSVTRREAELLHAVATLAATNLGAAITWLDAQPRDEASAAMDYTLGNLYAQTNRVSDAETAYREALRKHPRFRAARSGLGRLYLMDDQPARAAEALAGLVRDGVGDADTLLLLGQALLLAEQPLAAEGAFRHALLLNPGDVEARRGLARCLLEQHRHAEGEAILRELLGYSPRQADLWALLVSLQLTQDRGDAALVSLETARRLDASTPDMLGTLGELYLVRGAAPQAQEALLAALAADPAVTPRRLRAAEAMVALGETAAAVGLLDALEAVLADTNTPAAPPESRTVRRLRAELAEQGGDLAAASAAYETLLREAPLDGDCLLALGRLHDRAGRAEEAVMAFARAARLPGFEARALERQAQVEVGRGRYAVAVALLERAQAFQDQPHVARYLEQVRRLLR